MKKPKPSHLFDNLDNTSDTDSVYLDADDSEVGDLENFENSQGVSGVSSSKMAAISTVNRSDLVDALKEALKDPSVIELLNDAVKSEIESLKSIVSEKDLKIQELEDRLEGLEMYGRRNGVRIHGIPEKIGESTDEIVLNLAKKVGADIPEFALGRSHRVGPKASGKTRPIIAKFIGHNFKVGLLKNKKNLKTLKNCTRASIYM